MLGIQSPSVEQGGIHVDCQREEDLWLPVLHPPEHLAPFSAPEQISAKWRVFSYSLNFQKKTKTNVTMRSLLKKQNNVSDTDIRMSGWRDVPSAPWKV